VLPFWSSRSRLQVVQERFPNYRKYDITEMDLEELLRWLPELEKQGIHIGANWSGERLTGYDIRPSELSQALRHELDKLARGEDSVR
jgi:hypothetical protein